MFTPVGTVHIFLAMIMSVCCILYIKCEITAPRKKKDMSEAQESMLKVFLHNSSQHKTFQLHNGGVCNYCNRIENHKQTTIRIKDHVIIKTTQVNNFFLFVTVTWKTSLLCNNFIHNSFLLAGGKKNVYRIFGETRMHE